MISINWGAVGWAVLIALVTLFIWSLCRVSDKSEELAGEMDLNKEANQKLRTIITYFFTNNKFDFKKFTDYILCINEGMNLSEMAESIMELDLMLKCSPYLEDRMIGLLIYSDAIVELSYKDFGKIQQDIREDKYKGTYQDLVYIYMATIFYLKHQLSEKKKAQ